MLVLQRHRALAFPLPGTHRQHRLRRAFQVNLASTLPVPVQGRHEAAFGLEGYRIQPKEIFPQRVNVQPGPHPQAQQRAFGGVAVQFHRVFFPDQFGVVAQHPGAGQFQQQGMLVHRHRPAVQPEAALELITRAFHREIRRRRRHRTHGHFVAGQSACLVRADHRHRTQSLHRRQIAHDGVAPRHALHAHGQGDGDHGGQALGNGGDGDADHRHKHLGHFVMAEIHAKGERRRRQQQYPRRQPVGKLPQLPLQRRVQGIDLVEQGADAA